MAVDIRIGDALDQLRKMPDESVHCCVTSPPYWGLRDYGVDGQIGLEETPDEWCACLVEVFREAHRVLRTDGTCWVNVGDSYSAGKYGRDDEDEKSLRRRFEAYGTGRPKAGRKGANGKPRKAPNGYKPKDLVGQPWLLAFALRADGWFLRDAIVWHKPNPMPESVKDRCTNSYEHVFLLAKDKRYFFDAEAIREKAEFGRRSTFRAPRYENNNAQDNSVVVETITNRGSDPDAGRNCRNVWTISTEPYPEAHFATFPTELARRCILVGCPVGGIVLDPFGGAGTTGLVADRLQRNSILIELNADYAAMARRRIDNDRGDLFNTIDRHEFPFQEVMEL